MSDTKKLARSERHVGRMQRRVRRAVLACAIMGFSSTAAAQVTDLPADPLPLGTPQQIAPMQAPATTPQVAPAPQSDLPLGTGPNIAPVPLDGATTPSPLETPQPLDAPQPLTAPAPLDAGPAPQTLDSAANNFGTPSNFGSNTGATQGSFSQAPTMLGDFFGGGFSAFGGNANFVQTYTLPGVILNNGIGGGPGSPNSIIGFDVPPLGSPDDIVTTGIGTDSSGDGQVDTFFVSEPLPTSDANRPSGPGFVFDPSSSTAVYVGSSGGTAPIDGIYTDGEDWFISYAYTGSFGSSDSSDIILPSPGVAVRRVKISENYSPDVRDRCYFNYSFFNDAFGGLGDVSRFTFGLERVLVDDLISLELRLPTAATYGSTQQLGGNQVRDYEVGNPTAILKAILLRTENYLWTGGLGVSLPLADDTLLRQDGIDLVRVENESVHLQPFTGLLWSPNQKWALQGLIQVDVAANGDPILSNLDRTGIRQIGVFNDSTLITADVAATRVMWTGNHNTRLRSVLANSELHYTGTVQDSDFVSDGNLTYANLADNFNILNATVGAHFVFGSGLVVTPGMSVPLRDGFDEQFDYEAILQFNWLH